MTQKRWKVLMVVEATSAGVGRHVADLMLHMDLDRFDVTLAYSDIRSDDLFREELLVMQARGVRTVMIPMTREVNPKADLRALWQLSQLIWRERFDLVGGESSKAGFLARLASLVRGRSAITVYTPNSIAVSANSVYWYPEKIAGWFTDALIAVTDSEREQLRSYRLVPDDRLYTIIAGVSQPEPMTSVEVQAIRREFGVPDDKILIGTAGRIAPQKDPLTFIRTAERIALSGLPAHFLWLGDGVQRDEMEREVRQRNLTGFVQFAGYRRDARRLLGALDIFLLTSRYESFGYVTCEAMGFGRPVVGSRVTGTSELVDPGVTGLLAAPEDDEAFAAALRQLIEDDALRARMGEAGRLRAQSRFGLPQMVRQTEHLFESLLNEKNPGRARQSLVNQRTVSG